MGTWRGGVEGSSREGGVFPFLSVRSVLYGEASLILEKGRLIS